MTNQVKVAFAAAAAFAIISAAPANAATYVLDFTGSTDSGVVSFTTASPWTPGGVSITGVSGEIDGNAVTGLSGFAAADNLLFSTVPNVDFGGVSLTTALSVYNISSDGTAQLYEGSFASFPGGGYPNSPATEITGTIAAVPEPATWAMMLFGFGMVGFVMRSRRKQAVHVTYA